MRTKQRYLVVMCLAVFPVLGSAVASSEQTDSVRWKQAKALRDSGLPAAAAVTGSYIGRAPWLDGGGPLNIHELVQVSDVIVVGVPIHNASRLTRDMKSIEISYLLEVTEVIKGEIKQPYQEIRVVLPGGRVSFPDGSWAQMNTPGYLRPSPRQPYVWFLRDVDPEVPWRFRAGFGASGPTFVPAHGPLGIYRLAAGARVRTNGNFDAPLAREVWRARYTRETFLATIRKSVELSAQIRQML